MRNSKRLQWIYNVAPIPVWKIALTMRAIPLVKLRYSKKTYEHLDICELGLVGLLIWIMILVSLFMRVRELQLYHLRVLVVPLFLFLLSIPLNHTYIWENFYWLFFGLIAASSKLVSNA